MGTSYITHFAIYKTCNKQMIQLIPNVMSRLMYVDDLSLTFVYKGNIERLLSQHLERIKNMKV
jgi:hypothetical protein